jgi:hypothetical protein
MKTTEWIENIIKNGALCGNYTDKVNEAKSKLQLFRLCCDANGTSFLMEMQEKGMPLPYETITKEFASYINGRYVAEYRNEKGNGYTSKMYCCFDEDTILVDTTLCSVLGYTGRIVIAKNNFAKIYLDKNCDVQIELQDGARGIIEYWKGAKVEVLNMHDKVQLIEN